MSSEIAQNGSVLDLDTGEFHTPTEERKKMANHLHQQAIMGAFVTALAIKRIFDEKLYLELGCSSKSEYCDTMLPFGRRQAYRYVKVAEKFAPFMMESKTVAHVPESDDVQGFGYKKLYQLAQLDNDDLKALMSGQSVESEDGETSHPDLKEMPSRDFSEAMKAIKKKYSGRIAQLEETVKSQTEEMQVRDQKVKQAEERMKQAREIEGKFGSKAAKYSDKVANMSMAVHHINEACMWIEAAGVTIEDPENLQKDMADLLRKFRDESERASNNYYEIIGNLEL
jgi:Sec-independent protein translocase protein TatA